MVLVCAYCGLVKQVIYMEENMERIGLSKGLRKNGSTTTNHIDNIVMSDNWEQSDYNGSTTWPSRSYEVIRSHKDVRTPEDLLRSYTQMKVVTVTSICFGFVICLGPYYIFAVARILGLSFLRNNTVCDVSYHVSLVLIQVRLYI